jgi:hypothetical protein
VRKDGSRFWAHSGYCAYDLRRVRGFAKVTRDATIINGGSGREEGRQS